MAIHTAGLRDTDTTTTRLATPDGYFPRLSQWSNHEHQRYSQKGCNMGKVDSCAKLRKDKLPKQSCLSRTMHACNRFRGWLKSHQTRLSLLKFFSSIKINSRTVKMSSYEKESAKSSKDYDQHDNVDAGHMHDTDLAQLGYTPELVRTRSMRTILFQSLAITAVPFGEGTALTSAIYGGGQLSYFVGWIVVSILAQCVFMSLAELCSKFPTSAGPVSTIEIGQPLADHAKYYFTYQLLPANKSLRTLLSFVTGWTWLVGK